MCGIFYSVGIDRFVANEAFEFIKHRGPDSTVSIFDEGTSMFLGFHRLAIQDKNFRSSQPFWSRSRKSLILFNGEIYNTQNLIARFSIANQLTTQSDTEVIIELIEKIGLQKTILSLEGMFAIVYKNLESGKTSFVRDYFGIKRIYWSQDNGSFIASSEIKPIIRARKKTHLNAGAVHDWLTQDLIDSSEQTFFEDVWQIPPGHILTLDDSGLTQLEEWRPKWEDKSDKKEDFLDDLEVKLDECITQALVGDVKKGVLVSGGIDSSLLFNVSSRVDPLISAFSVDWPKSIYSEGHFIESLSNPKKHFLVDGFLIDFTSRVESSIMHFGQPFGSPFVVCLEEIFKLAQIHGVKVLLDGNGLDEMFFGYDKYRMPSQALMINRSQDGTFGLKPEVLGTRFREEYALRSQEFPRARSARDFDLLYGKIPRALRYSDQASMRYGIELRVPFLNRDLLDFANSINESNMYGLNIGKLPIRKVLERKIGWNPHIYEVKRTLQSPVREWFRDSWKGWVLKEIQDSPLVELGWLDYDKFVLEYERYIVGYSTKASNSLFLWQWLSLAIWSRLFLK